MRVSIETAFETLAALYEDRNEDNIPFRSSASPIDPATSLFLVGKSGKSRKRGPLEKPSPNSELVPVKFQGYHKKNMRVLWIEKYDYKLGIVQRRMLRRRRLPRGNGGGRSFAMKHGFEGFIYTLVKRDSLKQKRRIKDMVVEDVPSLVAFWESTGKATKVESVVKNDRRPSAITVGDQLEFDRNFEEPLCAVLDFGIVDLKCIGKVQKGDLLYSVDEEGTLFQSLSIDLVKLYNAEPIATALTDSTDSVGFVSAFIY
eukprot:snap_masked-scaffold_6-processed-gene-14.34-mRNA-1 protein AED:1.00 eAED:1.00 QI:0/0/0/0/1/1/2/0/257